MPDGNSTTSVSTGRSTVVDGFAGAGGLVAVRVI
jgi:hypothetical protein